MTQYRLTKASYLNDRYFAEGSVIDWDGPPNKAMTAVDDDGAKKIEDHKAANEKVHTVTEVPQEGGDPPEPSYAPQTKPAISIKTKRVPDSKRPKGKPKSTDNEASVTRVAASPKS